jgi:hypothetical protein
LIEIIKILIDLSFLLFLILCIFMLSRAQLVRRAQHLNTQLYRQAIVPLRI